MRKLATLAAAAALVLGFAGSAAATDLSMVVTLQADGGNGGGFPVGSVSVGNDDVGITINYTVTGAGYELLETHIAVDTDCAYIPQTKKGNPIFGKFPYSTSYEPGDGVTGVTYDDISLEYLGAAAGDDLCIAAHAVVAIVDYDDELGEFVIIGDVPTGTSLGEQFADDRNWHMFFIYTLQSHI